MRGTFKRERRKNEKEIKASTQSEIRIKHQILPQGKQANEPFDRHCKKLCFAKERLGSRARNAVLARLSSIQNALFLIMLWFLPARSSAARKILP
jgi:hypothetical protein